MDSEIKAIIDEVTTLRVDEGASIQVTAAVATKDDADRNEFNNY